MRSVRISLKTARSLLEQAWRKDFIGEPVAGLERAAEELARSMKPSPAVVANRKRRETKKKLHNQDTAHVRDAVQERARGLCELHSWVCEKGAAGEEMHHALGRKVAQSEANCVLLCRDCHEEITLNRDRLGWLHIQATFFGRLGHTDTARELRRKWHAAKHKESRAAFRLSRGEVRP